MSRSPACSREVPTPAGRVTLPVGEWFPVPVTEPEPDGL